MAEFLWIFWSFSLLGWGLERLFAAVTRSPQRRRRCLLLLPLCPVYGLGMAAVLALPPSLRSGWPLYLWGGLTATSVEYIYHWWGETFLSVSFWDYTGVFGNLRGRVCLPFSLAWGLLLFPAVYLVTPPVLALAWAVTVGGILQLVYQLPHLKKIGMLVLPRINFHDAGAMRVVKQMGPAILGVSVSQISLIINTIFASFLASGSVSWMYYADRLMEFPSGVLGVALGTILLPSLSKSFASGNHDEYNRLMDWGLRLCFLLALPSAVALGILSGPLTVSLFQYGKFTAFDALMTQRALIAYSVGLIGLIVVKVLAPGFYSRQDIKTPVKIAIVTLILTQLMNLAFIGPLKHAGLSLSIGLAACLNASLLYWQLRKQKIFTPQPGWMAFLLRLVVAVLVMSGVLLGMLHIMPEWSLGTMPWRLLRLMAVVLAGIAAYFAALAVLGFKVKEFARRTV